MATLGDNKGPDQIFTDPEMRFTSTDINGIVRLRIPEGNPKSGVEFLPAVSVPSLLITAANKCPDHVALAVKRQESWLRWSYAQYLSDVEKASRGFVQLGLEERKSVAIIGFNAPEWFISDLGAIFAGSVAVGVYSTNSAESTRFILDHCMVNIAVVEDDLQLQKVLKVKDQLPGLKAIVQYTGCPKYEGDFKVLSWATFLQMGEQVKEEVIEETHRRFSKIGVNQCCHLVSTSGTTGVPKAVMLSHDNLTWTAKCLEKIYNLGKEVERTVSYLPLSHVAASIIDMVLMLSCRGTTYFADNAALKGTLTSTLKEALPTVFFGVPRVWEKIQEKMMEVGRANKGFKRQIGEWAKKTGLKHNLASIGCQQSGNGGSSEGGGTGAASTLKYKLAQKIAFEKAKTALGLNKCHSFFVAAAPFSNSTLSYFLSLDIRVLEVYGMSETSGPHTVNTKDRQRLGTVGHSMMGCQTKIASERDGNGSGEILMSGRNIMMGYLNDPETTGAVLEDSMEGWLKSGDVGFIEVGFLTITGRIKEILVTAGGENIPPVPIEDRVKALLPCVSQAVVIGDRKKFVSCLLTLKLEVDPETQTPLPKLASLTIQWLKEVAEIDAEEHGILTIDDLLDGTEVGKFFAAFQSGIDSVNEEAISKAQKIQKWSVIRSDFSLQGGELGPTLKIKRHVVHQKYAEVINKFYR